MQNLLPFVSKWNPLNVFIITNKKVFNLYGNKLRDLLSSGGFSSNFVLMGDGEEYKNPEEFLRIVTTLIQKGICRSSPIIALGGGVTGDLAGFAASTVMRGVPLIHFPSTLIAQIDSSIGGKTGVNLSCGKNLLGTFYHPEAVFIDPNLLYTLSAKQFSNGMAEAVKSALIASPKLFYMLENCPSSLDDIPADYLEEIVKESVKIKTEIVIKDPREKGERMKLNLGHTLGHGFETASGYSEISHGEAVALGIMGALYMAEFLGFLEDKNLTERVYRLFKKFTLPVSLPQMDMDSVLQAVMLDKKKGADGLRFILPICLGAVEIVMVKSLEPVKYALNRLSRDEKQF